MFFRNYRNCNIKSNNILGLYFFVFLHGLMFFAPIWALYLQQELFSLVNVAIVISTQAFAAVIMEVPSGAFADLFGRKRSLLIGTSIAFISTILLYLGGSLTVFILYALISAIGWSLVSGTDNALIYDTLKEESKEHHYKKIIGTYHAIWPTGAVVASIIGGHLADLISFEATIIATMIPSSLAFLVALFLVEPKYHKEEHSVITQMLNSTKEAFANRQILLILLFGFIMWGIGESTHLLKSVFFEFKGISLSSFGYFFAFVYGFSAIGHYFSDNLSKKIGDKGVLIFSATLEPILVIIATMLSGIYSVIVLVIPSIFFGLRNPVMGHILNNQVTSSKRATILSINNFMQQLGKVCFAPFIGYLADLYTINTAFKISGFFMLIGLIFVLYIKDSKN